MSRWGKPIKNKKRIDPRYFLNEERAEKVNYQQTNEDYKTKWGKKSLEYEKQVAEDAKQLNLIFNLSKKIKQAFKEFVAVERDKPNYQALKKEYDSVTKESWDKMDQLQDIVMELKEKAEKAAAEGNMELAMALLDKVMDDDGAIDQVTDQVEVVAMKVIEYIKYKLNKGEKEVAVDVIGTKGTIMVMLDGELKLARQAIKHSIDMKQRIDKRLAAENKQRRIS
jgi:Holliday junction resolvase RusA-like endonuclease